jgi:hypothetical protein
VALHSDIVGENVLKRRRWNAEIGTKKKSFENIRRLAKTADVKNIVFKFSYSYQRK